MEIVQACHLHEPVGFGFTCEDFYHVRSARSRPMGSQLGILDISVAFSAEVVVHAVRFKGGVPGTGRLRFSRDGGIKWHEAAAPLDLVEDGLADASGGSLSAQYFRLEWPINSSKVPVQVFLHGCPPAGGSQMKLGRRVCWIGGHVNRYAECCREGNTVCMWDSGVFKFDDCCSDALPPGDTSCWSGPFNYWKCCEQYALWSPASECFDTIYTFERCCGTSAKVALFALNRKLGRMQVLLSMCYGAWLPGIMLSACVRMVWSGGSAYRKGGREDIDGQLTHAGRKLVVPAAATLRILAVTAIVSWHSVGLCGWSRYCGDGSFSSLQELASSFLVVYTDVFFVLSTYLTVVGTLEQAPVVGVNRIYAAGVDTATAILRRVVRTAPTFLCVACLSHGTFGSFLNDLQLGNVLGVTWPHGNPKSWPFGVELLCLVATRTLLFLIAIAGEMVGISCAVVLLAICLKRRHFVGGHHHMVRSSEPEAWHASHVALGGHRLPLCLSTLLLTWMLRHASSATRDARRADDEVRDDGFRALWCNDSFARAASVVAWMGALVGITLSGAVEWCWSYGPRFIVPWWVYPFPAKLPLVLGCVLLLEQSRNAVVGRPGTIERTTTSRVILALERRSLAVVVLHELVESRMLPLLPWHVRDFSMFLYQLPSVLFWCYVAASVLVWAEAPFRDALNTLLCVPSRLRPQWARVVVAGLLVLCAGAITAVALHMVCGERRPSPCLL